MNSSAIVRSIKGESGKGITSISGPSSNGLIDTYTINFSDNTSSTFTVSNGQDGNTPTITWDNTSIVIDGVVGPDLKGVPGNNGDYISSIDKTSGDGSPGTTDTYTITLSSGSTYSFDVHNGSNGQDGSSPTITWEGTSIVVNGILGPDLKGPDASGAVALHETAYSHSDINHTNREALDSVSGINTGDQDLSSYALLTDTRFTDSRPASDVYDWAKAANKPSYTASEVGADVSGTAADAISTHVGTTDPHTQYVLEADLATVATSGSYNDLTNKPTIPTDTNTTYSISAETVTGGANLRLTGSDTSTDNVKIASGTNVTVSMTDENTITISSSGSSYTHPTGDGNLHVPATGYSYNGYSLMAGATPGNIFWGQVDYSNIQGTPDFGSAAYMDTGTSSFTVAVGNHTHSGYVATTGGNLIDYTEGLSVSTVSGAQTLSTANGNTIRRALSGATTFTMPAGSASNSKSFVLIINCGGFAVSWAASPAIKWMTADGAAPVLNLTSGKLNILTFMWDNTVNAWVGFQAGKEV